MGSRQCIAYANAYFISFLQAIISAINPTCHTMEFQTQYGEDTCNSTCGVPYTPTTYTPSEPTTTPSTTSPELWNKTCVEEGKYYNGNYKEETNIRSWEQCAYLCKLDPECKGFVWVGPNYAGVTSIYSCALKTEIEDGKEEIVGLWRGTKECGDCKYDNVVKTATPP